jgi:GDSL-like Lipase/Acylhydrolase family
MPGTIERNISNLHDQDTGLLTGYVNPVTNQPAPLDAAAVAAASAGGMYTPGGQFVVAIGDSHQANGVGLTASGVAYTVNSPLNWGCALLKQALCLPVGYTSSWASGSPDLLNYSLAVSGSTTTDVIANQIGPAVSLRAPWWSVLAGTNDLTLRAGDSVTQIANRLRFVCQAGLNAGAKITLWTVPPRNDAQWTASNAAIVAAGSTIASQKLKHMALNTFIRRFAGETPGVVLIDPYNELVNPASAAGDWVAAYTFDGTHGNGAGCFVAGQVFAAAMRPFVKPQLLSTVSQLDVYNAASNVAGDFALSKGFQGSAAASGVGMSGTWPTGWTVDMQAGTATCVAAAQARTDTVAPGLPANGRELELAVSTAGVSSQLRTYAASTGAVIPANTPFYAEVEIAVSANTAAWQGPSLQMFFNANTPNMFSAGMFSDGSSLPVGALFDAVIRTPVRRSTTAAGGFLFLQMNLGAGSAATLRVRRASIRCLDPSMPGLLLGAA